MRPKRLSRRWAPRVATSSPPLENAGLAAQPSHLPLRRPGRNRTLTTTLLAQTVRKTSHRRRPPSPELTQVLQSMARDLQRWGQEIEQLRPARNKWPATMRTPPSSSRRAGNKWPVSCQGFGAELRPKMYATAHCRHDAQAGADAPVAASHSAAASRIIVASWVA